LISANKSLHISESNLIIHALQTTGKFENVFSQLCLVWKSRRKRNWVLLSSEQDVDCHGNPRYFDCMKFVDPWQYPPNGPKA